MKKNKNTTTSIRINDEILKQIKESGLTPQMIIDDYVEKHFEIEIKEKE